MTDAPTQTPDFDALYRADSDPWSVRSSFYEQRKLAILLASLTEPSYERAWDPGCGTGELVARLAARTDRVLATDISAEAVALTRRRCAELGDVTVTQSALPAAPAEGDFDLVVLSEFVYYLSAADRDAAMNTVDQSCASRAEVVSVHWRPKPHDAWLSGEAVQAEIASALQDRGWSRHTQHIERDFVLDIHRRLAPS